MARSYQTNPHEWQAKLGLGLATVGVLSLLALVAMVFRHFNLEEFAAFYLVNSPRFYLILVATAVGLATSGIGFIVSLNSAGQRRNQLSRVAWAAFFLNAAVITATLCVFVMFWFAREPIHPRPGP